MPRLIAKPTVVAAAGTKPKRIKEFHGRVNTGDAAVSVARMISPEGWQETGQRPTFEEITLVLRGRLRVEHESGQLEAGAGQAVLTKPGEWVRYGIPDPGGAEYVAACTPAFSLNRSIETNRAVVPLLQVPPAVHTDRLAGDKA